MVLSSDISFILPHQQAHVPARLQLIHTSPISQGDLKERKYEWVYLLDVDASGSYARSAPGSAQRVCIGPRKGIRK